MGELWYWLIPLPPFVLAVAWHSRTYGFPKLLPVYIVLGVLSAYIFSLLVGD